MATEFIMPRAPDQHQQPYAAQFHPYLSQRPQFTSPAHVPQQPRTQAQAHNFQDSDGGSSRQISPLSTSNNASPNSAKVYHGRQLRPLYIPAVLRPTDYPAKKTPTRKADDQDDDSLKASSSWTSLTGLPSAFGRLSRRSTGDSGKCMGDEWNLDSFPVPTAQPTRSHWKPDIESPICDEPSCMRHFNYWTRRHHCRKCGNIFCDSHSTFDVPLDQDAKYNPRGAISRACTHCYNDFQIWRSRTNSQASSDDASTRTSQTAPGSPTTMSTPTACKAPTQRIQTVEVAASVPRDWNWSTF